MPSGIYSGDPMMRKAISISVLIVASFVPVASFVSQARAAPFCLQMTGVPLQCLYFDPGACQREANRQGGRCAANPDEYKTPAGGDAFCVVQGGVAASCIYPDLGSCNIEANRVHGACIAATPATPPKAVDPYEVKRPY